MLFGVDCIRDIRFCRWDNGEIEKLSPWDVEAIPENGTSHVTFSLFQDLGRQHCVKCTKVTFKYEWFLYFS